MKWDTISVCPMILMISMEVIMERAMGKESWVTEISQVSGLHVQLQTLQDITILEIGAIHVSKVSIPYDK